MLKKYDKFKINLVELPKKFQNGDLRLVIDTEEDFENMKEICSRFESRIYN